MSVLRVWSSPVRLFGPACRCEARRLRKQPEPGRKRQTVKNQIRHHRHFPEILFQHSADHASSKAPGSGTPCRGRNLPVGSTLNQPPTRYLGNSVPCSLGTLFTQYLVHSVPCSLSTFANQCLKQHRGSRWLAHNSIGIAQSRALVQPQNRVTAREWNSANGGQLGNGDRPSGFQLH